METIPNVLAQRYASGAMCEIWSPEGRIIAERDLWIAVLKAQKDLGLPVSGDAIAAFESVREQVNLDSIQERERITRHDVKSRIEEFCDLAGAEGVHQGMTSRDLTENVEQLLVLRSLRLIRDKAVAAMIALSKRAAQYRDLAITGRTHNVAAQATTYGRRIAMFGEEMLIAWEALDTFISRYPARGLKGAVGTQLDTLNLFDGDVDKVIELEQRFAKHLGFEQVLGAPGQVYPRSLDFAVASALYQLGSGPASFARTLRLMAGHELASEGFLPGQVGSSAMPHKMNSRSCERIDGFHVILRGQLTMAAGLAGDQWNEGDVSCSVVRRSLLPDCFFAIDGLLETLITVLNQMEANPAVIEQENRHYLPFLLTTTVLMEAVKAGTGRETAHEVIKEHAVATARDIRSAKVTENDLFVRLATDERIPLSSEDLDRILDRGAKATGMAGAQTDAFNERVAEIEKRFPEAASFQPDAIL